MSDKFLVRAHKLILVLLLLQLLLPVITKGWSFRYSMVGQVSVVVHFLTGLVLFATIRNRVSRYKRAYLWTYPGYILLLFLAFVGDRIFFVICLTPLLLFVIPQYTYITNDAYSIRGNKTVMGRARAEVYKNTFVFQKYLGDAAIDPLDLREWKTMNVLDSAGIPSYVSLQNETKDTIVRIEN
jgi:hypothetical protein